MEEYVAKRLAKGAVAFGFGSYVTTTLGHSACPKSLLCMLDLLQLMFTLAPSGIEALSADPVPLALNSGVMKKQASPMLKKPIRAEEEDKGGTGGGRGGGRGGG